MSDSSPRILTHRTNRGEVRKHKLKDGKSRWHHIKNKKEIYIHRKDYSANDRSLTVQGLCFKASETVSWMLDVAVGARSSPRRKDLLHRPTAKKTNRKIKPLVGMEKFCLLRHFCLPSPSRECSALGPPSSAWREHLVWGCGRVRRACGQRRALGRRRCRHPWGSPHPCPCACPWGPGGCHPSTWGGNQGPAHLSRAR